MPLDFAFTEEQELFRKTIREFMTRNVAPRAKEMIEARIPETARVILGEYLAKNQE